MKLVTILLVSIPLICTAVDIMLFDNRYACTGLGTICIDIPHSMCCQSSYGPIAGSVSGQTKNSTDRITLYRKIGSNLCGVTWGVTHRLRTYCAVLGDQINDEHWVGGAAWSPGGGPPIEGGEACAEVVAGDNMFAEGGKMWVISREKMQGLVGGGVEVPRGESDMLAFFKMHADRVMDDGEGHSVREMRLVCPREGLM
ncbi:hypothetical protein CC86DRAFT_469017 [Ophiobolus disseminans]|uniref:Ecp2 effector protein domain-containing protein n=1 Tax=Ophiobolus disseminans TaxID=1469910 RepID=A0A6A6ZUS7_9PLEO|nr:hypothetical protein CC86DRAFT_469017 [Ophiobolus disseminans]